MTKEGNKWVREHKKQKPGGRFGGGLLRAALRTKQVKSREDKRKSPKRVKEGSGDGRVEGASRAGVQPRGSTAPALNSSRSADRPMASPHTQYVSALIDRPLLSRPRIVHALQICVGVVVKQPVRAAPLCPWFRKLFAPSRRSLVFLLFSLELAICH